ncbi:MAG: four helix bundle protein [Candidatus Edwardsbacteria bacterium]|nr:four helix bundle protein [Candidatus Edwardsbacteria bacterium]
MTVKNFEDLKIWQSAKQLTKQVYAVTSLEKYHRDYSLIDQTRRAAVSVMANIAEGFERENNKEFIRYLFIAKGSCGELRSHVWISEELAYLTAQEGESLRKEAAGLSVMIAKLIRYLKTSPIKGAKHKAS